jgi:hypothetical protein
MTEPFCSRKKLKLSTSAPGTGLQIVSWFIAYLRCAWWHVHPTPLIGLVTHPRSRCDTKTCRVVGDFQPSKAVRYASP